MVGIAQGSWECGAAYAKERKAFGRAIAEFQAVQFQLAEAATQIEAARLMVYNAARLKDPGQDFLKEAAMAKYFSSQVAESVTSTSSKSIGGYGYTRDYPAEKYFRDSKIGKIYEGTSNMQLQTIARACCANHEKISGCSTTTIVSMDWLPPPCFRRSTGERRQPGAEIEYEGLAHKAGQLIDEGLFGSGENAIVDFKYSASEKLTWWFDHHQSAFLSEADEIALPPRPSGRKFHDPAFKSCTKFIALVAKNKFGFEDRSLEASSTGPTSSTARSFPTRNSP